MNRSLFSNSLYSKITYNFQIISISYYTQTFKKKKKNRADYIQILLEDCSNNKRNTVKQNQKSSFFPKTPTLSIPKRRRASDLGAAGDAVLGVVGVPPVLRTVESLAVSPQRVGLLPVHGVVADDELFVRHSQGDEDADGEADDGGGDDVPADDEEGARYLLEELDAAGAAVEGAAGVGDGEEEGAERGLGEEAGGGAAEEAGDGVGVEDAESVVDLLEEGGAFVDHHHREPRDAAGEDAHGDGRPALHQS